MAEVKYTPLDDAAIAYDKEMFGIPTMGKTVQLTEQQAKQIYY